MIYIITVVIVMIIIRVSPLINIQVGVSVSVVHNICSTMFKDEKSAMVPPFTDNIAVNCFWTENINETE